MGGFDRPFCLLTIVKLTRALGWVNIHRSAMDTKSRARLIHLLISKSTAEALLITAVAVGFYFAITNLNLRGVLDKADRDSVTGWVVDEAHPSTRVEVQLFI